MHLPKKSSGAPPLYQDSCRRQVATQTSLPAALALRASTAAPTPPKNRHSALRRDMPDAKSVERSSKRLDILVSPHFLVRFQLPLGPSDCNRRRGAEPENRLGPGGHTGT